MFQSFIKLNLFAIVIMAALSTAHASHSQLRFGTISAAGNGCINGDITSYIDRVTGQLMIEPYDYTAILENGANVARKSCNFAIPVEVPAHRAVRLRQYRIHGLVALDGSSTAEINLEAFFAGQRGELVTLTLSGHDSILEREFDETIPELELVHGCGKDAMIRMNTSLVVKGGVETQVALGQIQQFGLKIDSVPCK